MKQLGRIMSGLMKVSQLLLLALLMVIVCQSFYSFPEAEFLVAHAGAVVRMGLLFGMTAFLALLFFMIYRVLGHLSRKGHAIVQGVCFAILLGGQLLFLLYYQSLYMWDSAYVVGGASTLLDGAGIADEAVYYFGQYPNQNAFAVVTKILLAIANLFGGSPKAQMLVLNSSNMICIDLAILLTCKLVKLMYQQISTRAFTMLCIVIACQPIFYMGVSYYYTITLSLPCFMGFLYLAVKGFEQACDSEKVWSRDLVYCVFAGVLLAAGVLIRATCLVPAIAFVIFVILQLVFHPGSWKKTGVSLGVMLLSFALFLLLAKPVINQQIGLDTQDTAFPTSHWIMMSMTSPGCHNAEDEAYTASFTTAKEKEAAVRERMAQKAEELGTQGFVKLALAKIQNTWSNGTNNYVLFMENCLQMDGMYPYLFGHHKDMAVLYHQAMLLLTLLGSLISVMRDFIKSREVEAIYLLQLTFFGGILFYLLWETGAQYSLPFLLTMILCGLDGFAGLSAEGIQLAERNENEKEKNSHRRIAVFAGAALTLLCGLALIVIPVCLLSMKDALTKEVSVYKSPVVNQLIANGEISGDETITQTFQTDEAFNQIVFQWRNMIGEDNQAVYRVRITDAEGNEIVSEEIVAKNQPYQGAFLKDLEMQTPDRNMLYTISIEKTDETEDSLSFVCFSCGKYAPYPNGELTKAAARQNGALMFQVSRIEQKSYTSLKKFVFFMLMIEGVFLILQICCILMSRGMRRHDA